MNDKLLLLQFSSNCSKPWKDETLDSVLAKIHKSIAEANNAYKKESDWTPLVYPVSLFTTFEKTKETTGSIFFCKYTIQHYTISMVLNFDHELSPSELNAWRSFKYGFLASNWSQGFLYPR